MNRTLGTQLRHLIELLDGAVTRSYEQIGLTYRPRYTPIMRILSELESCTIGDIAAAAKISQPAVTQTIGLMMQDGLVQADCGALDGRQKVISLTDHGLAMLPTLLCCWSATADAASSLDNELSHSLTQTLEQAIAALEAKSFDARIAEAHETQLSSVKTKARKKQQT